MTTLLTWLDRSPRARPHHQARSPTDRGPVARLLDQPESAGRYDRVLILTTELGLAASRTMQRDVSAWGKAQVRVLDVPDPTDHARLFAALGPVLDELKGQSVDVVLSAGTPQAQTMWVILVQAGLLDARMLQVIPEAFVGRVHERAVREVRLDIEGFPEIVALRREVRRLRAVTSSYEIVGESLPMAQLQRRLLKVAPSTVPVVVLGETGTGKELVARAVHACSLRSSGPFVAESCAAFAEGVLQSELFGHEKGAFTGASSRRRGLFEQAHGGTLFLDEVGELSPRVQVQLLRVLQEGAVRRVGGESLVPVDVRIVAATHRDLSAMVRDGTFREDLYYRLCGATLQVPALRTRGTDLDLLIRHVQRGGHTPTPSARAWRALRAYRWPGNVRELRAEVVRWGLFCGDVVHERDLSPAIRGVRSPRADEGPTEASFRLQDAVWEAEQGAIERALHETDGAIAPAARLLGIARNTLKRKLAERAARPGVHL